MNGNMHPDSANTLRSGKEESPGGTLRGAVEELQEKKGDQGISSGVKRLEERVRKEVKERFGPAGDEMLDEIFDEDDSAEVEILDEEEVVRGTRDVGRLWKWSLFVTISFATYVLLSGPRFEPDWIPNITEREPIPKIYRPKNRKK